MELAESEGCSSNVYLAGDGFGDQPFHFGRLGTGIARHDDGRFDDKRSVFLLSQFAEGEDSSDQQYSQKEVDYFGIV